MPFAGLAVDECGSAEEGDLDLGGIEQVDENDLVMRPQEGFDRRLQRRRFLLQVAANVNEAALFLQAVDVLGQYLARTHELFDQQLGFQQALVAQIENQGPLFGAAAAAPAEEVRSDA